MMTPPSSSFLTRSLTDGADSPTCSPSLTSGILPCSCSRAIICRSIASSSGESPPNFIRLSSSRVDEDRRKAKLCQAFIRCGYNKTLVCSGQRTLRRRNAGRHPPLPVTYAALRGIRARSLRRCVVYAEADFSRALLARPRRDCRRECRRMASAITARVIPIPTTSADKRRSPSPARRVPTIPLPPARGCRWCARRS